MARSHVARNETSAFGAALDPIADKLLITAALVLLIRNGVIHGANVIAVLVILLRELLVAGLREAVAGAGGLAVSRLAKWKTTAQLVAAALLLGAAPSGWPGPSMQPVAIGALWLAAALTFWTGAQYVAAAVKILNKA